MAGPHPYAIRPLTTALLLVAVALSFGSSATAQGRSVPIEEVRVPEVFAHIGAFRAGSDEGAIGTGASYSGAVTIPISRKIAADLDYQTSEVTRTRSFWPGLFTYETRRRLFVTSVLYRFGRQAVYGFVGGGIGDEFASDLYRIDYRPEVRPTSPGPLLPGEIPSGIVETHISERHMIMSFRGGVVAFPTRRFGVRGDVYLAGWNIGARIGAGYRF